MKIPPIRFFDIAMLAILIVLFASFGLFIGYRYQLAEKETEKIGSNFATATETFQNVVKGFSDALARAREENAQVTDALRAEQAKMNAFEDQINGITSTVGTLQKLSAIDRELLKKYSRVYFLNENYVPHQLSLIDSSYISDKNKPQQFYTSAWPFLDKLLVQAKNEGVDVQVLSGYRSFGTQSSLKSTYSVIYGAGTANRFSADQGYSEHQLGTSIDFTTTEIGSVLSGFEKTNAYTWLANNAYRYGFILSYPKNNTYYIFEPWHWRFVGLKLADKLHTENKNFYDMDQRAIDTYLINLFDQSF